MARRLDRIAPTSSIARLLDRSAVAGAFETVATKSPARQTAQVLAPKKRSPSMLIKRELVLSREADRQFQSLIDACRQSTRTRLTASHVARALMRVVEQAMPTIHQALDQLGPQKLPSNAPSFGDERDRFESQLARAIGNGLTMSAVVDASDRAGRQVDSGMTHGHGERE